MITTSYAAVVTELTQDWIQHASANELAAAVRDLAVADYLPKELATIDLSVELTRYWLTYALHDSGTPYPAMVRTGDYKRSLEVYLACVVCNYAWGCDYNSDEDALLKVAYWRNYANS